MSAEQAAYLNLIKSVLSNLDREQQCSGLTAAEVIEVMVGGQLSELISWVAATLCSSLAPCEDGAPLQLRP